MFFKKKKRAIFIEYLETELQELRVFRRSIEGPPHGTGSNLLVCDVGIAAHEKVLKKFLETCK